MAANAEQVTAAREAMAALPAEQRATLELAYYEGLTQSEIAQADRHAHRDREDAHPYRAAAHSRRHGRHAPKEERA